MFAVVGRFFGKSVHGKLTLGFGAVLLLSITLSGIALRSINQLTDRSEALVESASLATLIAAVRLKENEFDRNGQSSAAQAYTREVEKLGARVNEIRASLGSEASETLDHISAVAGDYEQAFDKLVTARHQATSAEKAMLPAIEAIEQHFGNVRQALFDLLPGGDPQSIERARMIVELETIISRLREQVQSYIARPTAEGEQRVAQTADSIRNRGNELWERLPNDTLQAQLVEGLRAVLAYQDRVKELQSSVSQSESVKQTLLAHSEELQRLATIAYQQQVQGRDTDVRSAHGELLVAQALALLLGLGAAWLITRQIVPQLHRALALARHIAAGDLTGNLDHRLHDELGQLMDAMREMARHLRQIIGHIGASTERLTVSATDLSGVATRSSAGLSDQRHQTEQVATAMGEMVASARHVAEDARQASQLAITTEARSVEGDRVIREAVEQFEALASNVQVCNQAMARLRHDGERISGVLNVIRDVADKTNLLALNAAIEAARAGESGRGFAVVADEVRALAQRTQSSTREIEALVHALHTGTQEATTLMERSESMSHTSVQLAHSAGHVLEEIRESVASIQAANQQIVVAADRQTQLSEHINENITTVRSITENSTKAGARIASASQELSSLGAELNELIRHFTF